MGTSRTSTPIVEFPVEGRVMRFAAVGTNLKTFEAGDQVPVAYRKSNWEDAYVRTFGQQYGVPLLMLLFASPFLFIAIMGTRRLARPKSTR